MAFSFMELKYMMMLMCIKYFKMDSLMSGLSLKYRKQKGVLLHPTNIKEDIMIAFLAPMRLVKLNDNQLA